MSRSAQAQAHVAAALNAGVMLSVPHSYGFATVGPYQSAVRGRANFAILDWRRGGRNDEDVYNTADEAAWAAVDKFGTGNVIAALKVSAVQSGKTYQNLTTPIKWRSGALAGAGVFGSRSLRFDDIFTRR